jgi:hypothetical protein
MTTNPAMWDVLFLVDPVRVPEPIDALANELAHLTLRVEMLERMLAHETARSDFLAARYAALELRGTLPPS